MSNAYRGMDKARAFNILYLRKIVKFRMNQNKSAVGCADIQRRTTVCSYIMIIIDAILFDTHNINQQYRQ